jgi:hypothetical protein
MDKIKFIEKFEEDDDDDWLDYEIYNYIESGPYQNFNTKSMDKFEFKILGNIMKEDKEGNEYLFKKVIYKMYEDVNCIGPVTQVLNSNGSISKSRCSVYFNSLQTTYIVKHPYEEIRKLKEDKRVIIKGFKR